MSNNLEKFEDVKSFDDAETMLIDEERVNDLKSLFSLWKRAHALEVEEWKEGLGKKGGVKDKRKPNTVPESFLDKMESAMKYSFCGDGHIGRACIDEKDYKNPEYSNMWDEEMEKPRKFTRFLILKEENHIQKEHEWEQVPNCYNSYYGEWAYKGTVKRQKIDKSGESKIETVSAPATRLGKIVARCAGSWEKHTEKSEMQEVMKKCAIINVNKRGGGSKSDKSLANYFGKYKLFFLKEINLLRSDSEPLEFFVFGKGVSYYGEMKKALKGHEQFGIHCKVYNLSHPARQMSDIDRKDEWEDAKKSV